MTSAAVTPRLFETLGVAPLLGRAFEDADAAAGPSSPIVIGHGLWQRRFAGDAGIVGRSIQLDGQARTVVAVMPAAFRLPLDYRAERPTELWTVLTWNPAELGQWGNRSYIGVARLAADRTPAEATSELAVIADHGCGRGWCPTRATAGCIDPPCRSPISSPLACAARWRCWRLRSWRCCCSPPPTSPRW